MNGQAFGPVTGCPLGAGTLDPARESVAAESLPLLLDAVEPTGADSPMGAGAAVEAASRPSEYADYMRTDALLSLQRPDDVLLHRDERLFQCVHQSTELWLKQAHFELTHAADLISQGRVSSAAPIVGRAAACIALITDQVKLLSRMSSFDFGRLRPALGQGSGLESPGWSALRADAPALLAAFTARCDAERLTLGDLFRGGPEQPLYALAEALLDLDTQVSVWRLEHLFITVRTIGTGGVGTKGMPVQSLARLLNHRLFPSLWDARSATAEAS